MPNLETEAAFDYVVLGSGFKVPLSLGYSYLPPAFSLPLAAKGHKKVGRLKPATKS